MLERCLHLLCSANLPLSLIYVDSGSSNAMCILERTDPSRAGLSACCDVLKAPRGPDCSLHTIKALLSAQFKSSATKTFIGLKSANAIATD